MTGFGTLAQVALREIRERGRSKAYLFTTLLTLVIVTGLIIVPPIFQSDTEEAMIGSIGGGNDVIIETAIRLANANDEPGEPPSLDIETITFTDREEAALAIEEGEVDAVLIDGREILVETAGASFGGSSMVGSLQRAASTVEIDEVIVEEGETAADIIELLTTDRLVVSTVSGDDPRDESQWIIAYAGLMLLYLAILLYGTWILTGVTEEKTSRVVEVLLSSVRPWQILGGKILGIGLLALSQLLGTLIVAFFALRAVETVDLPPIEISTVLNLLLWFVLGFLIFAVLFGASGALVSRSEDAQTIALPMSFAAVIGFFVSISALNSPESPVAVVSSLVPLTAPFVVPVRAALDAIPLWQHGLAVVICIASIIALTYVGGRIYAGGLLRFGSRVGYREAWRSAGE
jgi:ABC-2 type transport system permease protein